jgi:hypothetical protein
MRTRILLTHACVLITAALAPLAEGTDLTRSGTATRDCVLDVVSHNETCFDSFRDAITFATDGAIADAPASARLAATDPRFHERVARLSARRVSVSGSRTARAAGTTSGSSVIGATLFTGTGYTGDSETLRIPRPCVKDGSYDFGFNLGTIGRNAHSVQPWADCWIWLHSGNTWDSPRQGPYKVDTPDLGGWNGRAVMMGLS